MSHHTILNEEKCVENAKDMQKVNLRIMLYVYYVIIYTIISYRDILIIFINIYDLYLSLNIHNITLYGL